MQVSVGLSVRTLSHRS